MCLWIFKPLLTRSFTGNAAGGWVLVEDSSAVARIESSDGEDDIGCNIDTDLTSRVSICVTLGLNVPCNWLKFNVADRLLAVEPCKTRLSQGTDTGDSLKTAEWCLEGGSTSAAISLVVALVWGVSAATAGTCSVRVPGAFGSLTTPSSFEGAFNRSRAMAKICCARLVMLPSDCCWREAVK